SVPEPLVHHVRDDCHRQQWYRLSGPGPVLRPSRGCACPGPRHRSGRRQHSRQPDRQDRRRRAGAATGGRVRAPAGFVFMLVLTLMPARVSAQSVSDVLSFLLTNRAVQTDDFQRDAAAAAATRDTVTTLLGAELA